MRDPKEIVEAHALLTAGAAAVARALDAGYVIDPDIFLSIVVSADVLGWVTDAPRDADARPFDELLAQMTAAAAEAGLSTGETRSCEGCRCSENDPCPGGCSWSAAFRAVGRWVCTRCEPSTMRSNPPVPGGSPRA